MPRSLLDTQPLYDLLELQQHHHWATQLRQLTQAAIAPGRDGHLPLWTETWQQLPNCPDPVIRIDNGAVAVDGTLSADQESCLHSLLKVLHPWRKGPFRFFSTEIDTEWRSCLKWDRLAPAIDFRGRKVVDVGCGNGPSGRLIYHVVCRSEFLIISILWIYWNGNTGLRIQDHRPLSGGILEWHR